MRTLSLSEVKARLSELVDRVGSTDEEITITKNGRAAAVLVSPDEFDSWKETLEIQGDPELMREIRNGLRAMKSKKPKRYTLDQLFK